MSHPLEHIVPNPHQPRRQFDEAALQELADSIRQHGVLQPILLRQCAKDRLFDGECQKYRVGCWKALSDTSRRTRRERGIRGTEGVITVSTPVESANPLIFLGLRILFNIAFAQLLKLAQTHDGHMLPAACVNYIVAALLGGAGMLLLPAPVPQALSVGLGLATGLTYALSLLGLERAVRTSGVSISVAILQISVLVPTVLSITLFRERPAPMQSVGVALALPALWLLSRSQTVSKDERLPADGAALTLFLLFLVTGCSGFLMKLFEVYCPPSDRLAYATALFAVSALVIGLAVVRMQVSWGPLAWPIGSLVGICNLLQLEMTLLALSVLPTFVVFPVSSALTVVLSALLSFWFWRERLNARAFLGMALAILSALLLNGHR